MRKVAICFHGKIGGLGGKNGLGNGEDIILYIAYSLFKKNILLQNKNLIIDVFIHCWDPNYQDDFNALYKPKSSIFEKPKSFNFTKIPKVYYAGDPNRLSNHCSRWYSYKKAVELKSIYEKENNFKYDSVLSSRIDMAWSAPLIFNEMDANYIWHSKIILYENKFRCLYPKGYAKLNKNKNANYKEKVKSYPNSNGLWDAWFLSSSDVSNTIASIYDSFEFYALYRGKNSKISHHKILFDLLDDKKYIHLLKSYKDYTVFFPVRLSFEIFSSFYQQKQDHLIFSKKGYSKNILKKILIKFKQKLCN